MSSAYISLENPSNSELNDAHFKFLAYFLSANERVRNAISPILLHLARSRKKGSMTEAQRHLRNAEQNDKCATDTSAARQMRNGFVLASFFTLRQMRNEFQHF